MLTKNNYETPTTETIVVRFSQTILQGSDGTNDVNYGYESENDLGEI